MGLGGGGSGTASWGAALELGLLGREGGGLTTFFRLHLDFVGDTGGVLLVLGGVGGGGRLRMRYLGLSKGLGGGVGAAHSPDGDAGATFSGAAFAVSWFGGRRLRVFRALFLVGLDMLQQ